MSSMTLKEFMTRGTGGMEKRGDSYYIDPEWRSKGRGGPVRRRKGVNQRLFDTGTFAPLLAYKKLQEINNGNLTPDVYKSQFNTFREENPQFFDMLEGINRQFAPKILSGDMRAAERLRVVGNQVGIPSDFIETYISKLSEAGEKYSWLFKDNPRMAESLALNYVNRDMLKMLGVDPSMMRELMPGMKNYDMWQHAPGMAAAFGIPFGIGALLGHPGWGALLGLLGAGGYGYYQYSKMQNDLLNSVPNEEEKAPEEPPAAEPPAAEAPVAEKPEESAAEKTQPQVVSEPNFRTPWRVIRDAQGNPVSLWTPEGNKMYTRGSDGNWYLGDARGSRIPGRRSPVDVNTATELNRVLEGPYFLNQNIPGIPEGVLMDEQGNVYDANKSKIGTAKGGVYTPNPSAPSGAANVAPTKQDSPTPPQANSKRTPEPSPERVESLEPDENVDLSAQEQDDIVNQLDDDPNSTETPTNSYTRNGVPNYILGTV